MLPAVGVIDIALSFDRTKEDSFGQWRTTYESTEREGQTSPVCVSKNDDFCSKYEELCYKNEELCIKNEELCI